MASKQEDDFYAGLLNLCLNPQEAEEALHYLATISGLDIPSLKACLESATIVSSEKQSYKDIKTYVANGHQHSFRMKVAKIFRITRKGEHPYHKGRGFRMMLWHGTKKTNVGGILKNGFFKPAQTQGLMFGSGVYFADRASKSANYMDGTASGKKGYLFLCDVKLGKMYSAAKPHNDWQLPPAGFTTAKGVGQYTPDRRGNTKYYGSIMPVGETIEDDRFENYSLMYNEYIVYDPKQVIVSFLVEIDFY